MYNFYFNITDWSTPLIDGTYIEGNPIYNTVKITRERHEDSFIRVRDIPKGTLTFYGEQAQAFKTLLDANNLFVGCKIYYGTTLILTCDVNLFGTYNTQSNICELNLQVNDIYTKLLKSISTEFDIDVTKKKCYAEVPTSVDLIYLGYDFGWTTGGETQPESYIVTDPVALDAYSAVKSYDIVSYDNVSVAPYTALYYYGDPDNFVTFGGDTYASIQPGNQGNQPDISPTWWAKLEPTVNYTYGQEQGMLQFRKLNVNYVWEYSQYNEKKGLWYMPNDTTDTYTVEYSGYKLFDLIEFFLSEIDTSILISETGANEFCSYIDRYTFFIPKDVESKITLKSIIEIYKTLYGVDWYIDSSNYFRFLHPSELNRTLPNLTTYPQYKLTDLFGKDWTVWEEKMKVDDQINVESWAIGDDDPFYIFENRVIDFKKAEINYNVNVEVRKDHTIQYSTVIYDNSYEKRKNLIVSCNYVGGAYIVTYIESVVTGGVYLFNGDLSAHYIVKNNHLMYNRPYVDAYFLEVLYEAEKAKNIEIINKVPVFNQTTYSIDNLIRTNLADMEIKEITVNLSGQIAEIITLK
jgi:hypothetical protein